MSRCNHSRAEKKQKRISSHLEKINLFAAGIDIGSETHFVAVPEDLDERPWKWDLRLYLLKQPGVIKSVTPLSLG